MDSYFLHLWLERFPSTPTVTTAKTSAEVLRQRLTRALRKAHGEPVEVKESFVQESEVVKFSILAKRHSIGKWEELIQLERPRLKSARAAAYTESLKITSTDPHIWNSVYASHGAVFIRILSSR